MKEIQAQKVITREVMRQMAEGTAVTAESNYWEIATWWEMPYGKVARGMWIGHAENPDDRIWWENPRPPDDPRKIINWGKDRNDQFWLREELPRYWSRAYLDDIAVTRFSEGKTRNQRIAKADYYWHKDPENLSDEQFFYQDREWERRLEGVWIMINGEVVYLPGKYYTYLQWWYLEDCYPEFRDRDLLTFYGWQAVCDDPLCAGAIFPKHRRAGDTSKWAYEGVEQVTRTIAGHFGIQAAGKTGAQKVFTDKVVKGWKRWPPFFKPVDSSGDNPKTEIILDSESRKGKSKHTVKSAADSLEGWIKYEGNGDEGVAPFDGDKMVRYFRDEGGKEKLSNIIDTWELVRPCLTSRNWQGKAAWPSTVEDISGKHKGAFERLYKDSMPSLALTTGTGRTVSGLKALFIPCYCGHERFWFVGKFGESIVHKPTPEQREWLLENRAANDKEREELEKIYDQGGAYEYELRERVANGNSVTHKRKFPFTVKDVFLPNVQNSDFNVPRMARALEDLQEIVKPGKTLYHELTIQGRLEFMGEILKSDVYFVKDPSGPFIINRKYLPVEIKDGRRVVMRGDSAELWGGDTAERLRIFANNVERDPPRQGYAEKCGSIRPRMDDSWIVIGMDPQKIDKDDQRAKRISKASSHGFYPFNPMVDGEWTQEMERNPDFAEEWESHAWVFHYLHHPKNSRVHHMDMLKACIFWNARILYERQVKEFGNFMREIGGGGFMVGDRAWAKDKSKSVWGFHSDENYIKMYLSRLQRWIDKHCYAKRCPFPDLIDQWLRLNPANMEVFDAVVSSGAALLAAQPGELRKDEKFGNLQPQPVATFNLGTCYPTTRRK